MRAITREYIYSAGQYEDECTPRMTSIARSATAAIVCEGLRNGLPGNTLPSITYAPGLLRSCRLVDCTA